MDRVRSCDSPHDVSPDRSEHEDGRFPGLVGKVKFCKDAECLIGPMSAADCGSLPAPERFRGGARAPWLQHRGMLLPGATDYGTLRAVSRDRSFDA
jgi:hypothetical protein